MANSKNKAKELPKDTRHLLPVRTESKRGRIEGRKPAMTPTVLLLLREAFLIGCDDQEACLFAGISHQTLYNYQKENKAFVEWKEALKRTPFLKARKTIVDALESDPEFAMRYMERKKKAEFAPQAKITIDDDRPRLDDDTKKQIGDAITAHILKLEAKRHAGNDQPAIDK
jgi:hypothetical protein